MWKYRRSNRERETESVFLQKMDGVNEGRRKRLFTEENSIKGRNIRGTFGGITRTWRGKKKSAYSEKGGSGGRMVKG